MKRLVEQSPGSTPEQRLTELLRRIEPAGSDPFRKRRVWSSLMSARSRSVRRGPRALRALWIAVLLGGGTAAAALGNGVFGGTGGWSDHWLGSDTPAEPPAATAPDTSRLHSKASAAGEPSPAAAASPDPGAPDDEPSADRDAPDAEETTPGSIGAASTGGKSKAAARASGEEASRTRDAARSPSAAAPPAPARPTGEDPTPVVAAIRAWRSEGDAARAQRLLDRYLRDNPRGALAEDALALSIEVAAARKDPRAVPRAKRYLAAYPKGRFRSLAEKVVRGSR